MVFHCAKDLKNLCSNTPKGVFYLSRMTILQSAGLPSSCSWKILIYYIPVLFMAKIIFYFCVLFSCERIHSLFVILSYVMTI